MLNFSEPVLLFSVRVPRPSLLILYVPEVNAMRGLPCWAKFRLTSSTPAVIFPCPSAVNEPIRAKGTATPVEASVPAMENAYCPCKLLFVKPLLGGGGVIAEPLPLQAAAHSAAALTQTNHSRLTAHLP